jgi:hypothetical protein
VPADPRLVVEAHIRTEDVSRVHQAQAAEIRFTAYKYRTPLQYLAEPVTQVLRHAGR